MHETLTLTPAEGTCGILPKFTPIKITPKSGVGRLYPVAGFEINEELESVGFFS